MSKIYLDLLDKSRKKVFSTLSAFKPLGYLAGGTALALQINHRKSKDFDVFINQAVDNNLRLKIKKTFGEVNFYANTDDQISFETKNHVKITFLWYYFKPLKQFIDTDSLSLVSVDDIAADKAITIGRRAVWRDYVDIFFLLKEKILTLDSIISYAKKKFKGEFVETQFLEQLSYFGDLKEVPIEFVKHSYSSSEIKPYLEKEVSLYVKKKI